MVGTPEVDAFPEASTLENKTACFFVYGLRPTPSKPMASA
jgi:hypothetical protein